MANTLSDYARFFDEMSSLWNNKPEYNQIFLQAQQNYWNDMLKARGHVFLNEVYGSLGIPHSKSGSIMGWAFGDVIDFGIEDGVNEGAILLDFNVSTNVYDFLED